MPDTDSLKFYSPLAALDNWHAMNHGVKSNGAFEAIIFTDAQLLGRESTVGPYRLINTFADMFNPRRGRIRPGIVVQASSFENKRAETWSSGKGAANSDAYHGGGFMDEIAALISLFVGIRAKAGPPIRRFESGGDPRGTPAFFSGLTPPQIVNGELGTVLPWHSAAIGHSLDDFGAASAVVHLRPEDASALMRAARLYQDAVWIADADAETAWLFLVSAVECVAKTWKDLTEDPVAWLRRLRPKLVAELEGQFPQVLDLVAKELKDYVGATARFREFIGEFLPIPPSNRPTGLGRIEWVWPGVGRTGLKKRIEQVYDLRSKALHSATPFPWPICSPPMTIEDPLVFAECPLGDAFYGATRWSFFEMPMHIHIFAYIVRGCILRWVARVSETTVTGA